MIVPNQEDEEDSIHLSYSQVRQLLLYNPGTTVFLLLDATFTHHHHSFIFIFLYYEALWDICSGNVIFLLF